MSVEFKEGAVCFAGGKYWYAINDNHKRLVDDSAVSVDIETLIKIPDFKLNTIKQGDYIEASELNIEQKYNDAVDVFGLFGFDPYLNHGMDRQEFIFTAIHKGDGLIADSDGDLVIDYDSELDKTQKKRKLTYPQIMAIGELKRLEIGRQFLFSIPPNHFLPIAGKYVISDKELERPAPKIAPDLTPDLVQNPSHYQFFEGVEVIEIIASSMTCEQFKGYCLGNRIKYRLRAGNKDKLEQEIAKSDKYVELYDEHKHLCKK